MNGTCFDQHRFAYLLGEARRKDLGSSVIQMEAVAVEIPRKLALGRQYPDRKANCSPISGFRENGSSRWPNYLSPSQS
jgi:hypothetical protein